MILNICIVLTTIKKIISSAIILHFLKEDIKKIKNEKWLPWEKAYLKNELYTPGDFIKEKSWSNKKIKDLCLFIFILIIMKIIVRI